MSNTEISISYRQLMSILKARRLGMVKVVLVTVALIVVASLIVPKRYTASASVVVDGRSKDPVDGTTISSLAIPGYLATQVGILKSERVALHVIRELQIDKNPEFREEWESDADGQGDYNSWLAAKLVKKLDVKPTRDSSVIDISYSNRDPKFAADMANAFLRGYLDTTLEIRVDPAKQYNAFFDDRTKQARDDLEVAQRKLSAYQQSKGLLTTDERVDVETTKLNDLSARVVALQSVATETSTRAAQTTGDRRDTLSEVLNDHVVSGLRSELTRQEGMLEELTSRLGDNHPKVVQARAGLADMKKRLAEESAKVVGSLNVNSDVNRSRLAELTGSLEAQRAKVMRLKVDRDEATVLQRDVENAQHAYDVVIGRMTRTNLESQTTQSNISVLKYATVPGEASFPRFGLNVVASIVLGLLLALPIVVLQEMRDRRIYIDEDVIRGLQQPLLAVLPLVQAVSGNGGTPTRRSLGLRNRVLGLPRAAE